MYIHNYVHTCFNVGSSNVAALVKVDPDELALVRKGGRGEGERGGGGGGGERKERRGEGEGGKREGEEREGEGEEREGEIERKSMKAHATYIEYVRMQISLSSLTQIN